MKRRGSKQTYKKLREENAKLRAILALHGWPDVVKYERHVVGPHGGWVVTENQLTGREEFITWKDLP